MSRIVHTDIWSAYGYAKKAGYTGTVEEFEAGLKKSAEADDHAAASAAAAAESEENAAASATAAATSAENAALFESNAQGYASAAAGAASDAQGYASTATTKATQAGESAGAAESSATTATTKAGEASTSATNAATSASAASASATAAAGSASAAATSESNAASSATSASGSATAAATSASAAQAAQAAAEEVAESIPEDYSELSDEVSGLKNAIMKTVIPSTYSTGYIGSDGSAVTTNTDYYYCDYIKIPFASGTNIKFKVSMLSSRGMAFYDVNKEFISAINGNNCSDYGYSANSTPQEIDITVPDNARYVRITQRATVVTGVSNFAVTGVNAGTSLDNIAKIPTIETNLSNVIDAVDANTNARKFNVTFTDGGFITAGGIVSSHTSYAYSDFVFIGGLSSIDISMYMSGSGASLVLFDKTKTPTRYFKNNSDPLGTNLHIDLNDNEIYIRISCYKSYKSSFYLLSKSVSESIANAFRILNGEYDVPFSKIIHDGGMIRIFKTIGVIGDSLSSGEMAYGNASGEDTTEYTDMYDYSWIQYIARSCGLTAYNFSQGGMNTENFLTDTGGQLSKLQNSNYKCQAYFIALGHNDYNYGVPVGTTADINVSDPSQNPDTYYGNYARIISIIKTIQPNAKIFCVCMKSSHFADYNVAIRYMPTVYDNVYVLDFETYYPLLEASWEYTQGHGNAMGYLNYSWQIGTFVDWIIRNNRTDFKYVQFIGTDYDQYIPTN